ncbi:hypothetical protein K438DRAFT_2145364 [Mycena galopus ATCC 62051]|nr:hypothetical protein K438DRAFT_2145364 [Mycena galopus ATCC 62051]
MAFLHGNDVFYGGKALGINEGKDGWIQHENMADKGPASVYWGRANGSRVSEAGSHQREMRHGRAQRVQRGASEHQMRLARAGKAQNSRSRYSMATVQHSGGECGRGGGQHWAERETIGATRGQGAGYDADGGSISGGWRAHVRHEVNVQGNRLQARNAHGTMREGAQYAAGGRGSKRQARGNKRRYPNAGGRKCRHVQCRMVVYRITGWVLRLGGIFGAAVDGRRTPARGQLGRRRRGPRRAKHKPEGQQQLLWKGLLQLEVQQGITTVYSTHDNSLAEGEGLAKGRERRAAKGSWVARCKED